MELHKDKYAEITLNLLLDINSRQKGLIKAISESIFENDTEKENVFIDLVDKYSKAYRLVDVSLYKLDQ